MPVFVQSLSLRNYKSIARCKVKLEPLTLLVGPNGAGKSNFLDSIRLVAESLRTSLEHSLRDRGGIKEVRRKSRGHPTHFGIRLDLVVPTRGPASYAFEVGALPNGAFRVKREECHVSSQQLNDFDLGPGARAFESFFVVENGTLVDSSPKTTSKVEPDRLYLTSVSALPEFRPIYDGLSRMGFYNLNPDRIRDLQPPDAGELLARDGSNISSVLHRLKSTEPNTVTRIEKYLAAVVPGVESVEPRHLGPKETLAFRQRVVGDENPWEFFAANMSDGTLRSLGVLVAAFQVTNGQQRPIPLVGIEEPELAIHPGAATALLEALREASLRTQIVLTTHSPDILDDPRIEPDSILSVTSRTGETQIAPVDNATRRSISDRLYTAGELLRMGQIEPDEEALKQPDSQSELFSPPTTHAPKNNTHS
jgi:predicted ATPase